MIAKVTFASSKRLIGKRFRIKRREREEGSGDFGGDRSSFTSSASPLREIGCRSSRRVSPTKSEREREKAPRRCKVSWTTVHSSPRETRTSRPRRTIVPRLNAPIVPNVGLSAFLHKSKCSRRRKGESGEIEFPGAMRLA